MASSLSDMVWNNAGTNQKPDKDEEGVEFFTGDLIMKHSPFVKCLSSTTLENYCFRCFAPNPLLECAECNVARYCDLTCKVFDYRDAHSIECDMWNQSPDFRDYCIKNDKKCDGRLLLLRLYAMLKKKPELADVPWPSRYCRSKTFKDVLKRKEVSLVLPPMINICNNMLYFINKTVPSPQVDIADLIPLAGVIRTKRIAILDESGVHKVGYGIYIIPAMMKHGCAPTAFLVSRGPELAVRAITDILKRISPRISYIGGHFGRIDRFILLKYLYRMKCHCRRCLEESDRFVDFQKLRLAQEYVDEAWLAPPTEEIDWGALISRHDYIVKALTRMYEEHDPKVTEQYTKMMDIALKLDLDKRQIIHLYLVTSDQLMKTYGNVHPRYLKFEDATKEFLFVEEEEEVDPELEQLQEQS